MLLLASLLARQSVPLLHTPRQGEHHVLVGHEEGPLSLPLLRLARAHQLQASQWQHQQEEQLHHTVNLAYYLFISNFGSLIVLSNVQQLAHRQTILGDLQAQAHHQVSARGRRFDK